MDDFTIKSNADKIEEYYIKRGFSDIKVEWEIERNLANGLGVVTYRIDEGQKIKIADIKFVGNEQIKSGKLRGVMETKEWGWFSWLTGSGKFDEDEFRESIDLLIEYYQNEGFLDIDVDEDAIQIVSEKGKRMKITIPLREGRQYRLGNLEVTGNSVYTEAELLRLVYLVPGMVFSPEKVDEAAENLKQYYGSQGYLETFVRAERVPNVTTGRIDIDFRVRESEKIYVETSTSRETLRPRPS
jgi:outer membrane protein insertion porin family